MLTGAATGKQEVRVPAMCYKWAQQEVAIGDKQRLGIGAQIERQV